jgi:group I intron endonuclease
MYKSGIYIISSKAHPERIYIGSAVNLPARWNRHRRELVKKCHCNAKLTNSVSKYGIDDLYISRFFPCRPESLLLVEQTFINLYQPFFNICPVAGSRLGAVHSNLTRVKIGTKSRKAQKEKILQRYCRLTNIKPSNKGYKVGTIYPYGKHH